ncbi:MAG: ABC transporter permease subunit [Microthrixaceae bacterium]
MTATVHKSAPLALSPLRSRTAQIIGPALCVVAAQLVFLWISPTASPQVYVLGLTQGLLVALMATGLWLVLRTNQIINFAQADLGYLPATIAVNLVLLSGVNYLLALFGGLVVAVVVGGVIELAIMRRFFRSPRLIATVATIGVAQILGAGALWVPLQLWDRSPIVVPFARETFPIDWTLTVGGLPFRAAHLMTWIVAPLAMAAVAIALQATRFGVAVRASAESADRALMLGIPVKNLHTVVWAVAAGLSFLSLFLSAGLFGLPIGGAFGLTALLGGLCALVVGRNGGLWGVMFSGLAVGLLIQATTWKSSTSLLGLVELPLSDQAVPAVLGIVIVVALLVQHRGSSRVANDRTSTWRDAATVRPVPSELRSVAEVRALRIGGATLALVVAIGLPFVVTSTANLSRMAGLCGVALISLSLVVLIGWAGQVSLGQLAFAAIGGVIAAKATVEWNLDPLLAILAAAIGGAVVATVVGLPALRVRGLYLAVVTLAFALATVGYLLNPSFFSWVPTGRMSERPEVLGVFAIDDPRTFYWFCLAIGLAVIGFVLGLKRFGTARVLSSTRDNEAAVSAYGLSVVGAKLTAFAVSGAVAAVGGALLVYLQRGYTATLFPPQDNLVVFSAAVVGGVGSLLGALIGALLMQGGDWWLPGDWRLLVSGAGVLVVLLMLPSGIGGLIFSGRDALLVRIARRRGISVPSLTGDREDGGSDA